MKKDKTTTKNHDGCRNLNIEPATKKEEYVRANMNIISLDADFAFLSVSSSSIDGGSISVSDFIENEENPNEFDIEFKL